MIQGNKATLLAPATILALALALFLFMWWGLQQNLIVIVGLLAIAVMFRGRDGHPQIRYLSLGQTALLAVFTPIAAVTAYPPDNVLFAVELSSFAVALIPATLLVVWSQRDRVLLLPAFSFLWALIPPFWAWIEHDAYGTPPEADGCGRFRIISKDFGDAYFDFFRSWSYSIPAILLLLAIIVIAWRRRDRDLALLGAAAAMTTVVLLTYGIIKFCD